MKTKLLVAATFAGTLLATCFLTASAQATSLPVLRGDGHSDLVTLVGKKGGGGGGGGMRGGGGGGRSAMRSGGGGGYKGGYRGGGGRYAYKGGGYKGDYRGGGGRYAYKGGGYKGGYRGGDGKYGYKHKGKNNGRDHDRRHVNVHRRYYGWYGWPYVSYGYYGGGCGWLYRNAVATGSSYWWNRYYACTGYYY
jgi:hypothetical protein